MLELAERSVPAARVPADGTVSPHPYPGAPGFAAGWIASMQRQSGLVKSWEQETAEAAWLYDQALALLVFCDAGLEERARRLAGALHELQLPEGAWHAGYEARTMAPLHDSQPVGAVAWTVYALARYGRRCGSATAYEDAVRGAAWLAGLQRADGSLPALPGESGPGPTEPNLDAWWALRSAGRRDEAELLQAYLLTRAWDDELGRFKASPESYQIFLDNQTWGASFLRAVGRDEDADRALSYARATLAATSSNGSYCGLDGAGPFSVWNEGTLQYVVAGGEQSDFYWEQVRGQHWMSGGLPGSPDEFTGYVVWLTRWHGVAPTAWLYLAATGGPFWPDPVYLPLSIKMAPPLSPP
jgi:hypothetical protein